MSLEDKAIVAGILTEAMLLQILYLFPPTSEAAAGETLELIRAAEAAVKARDVAKIEKVVEIAKATKTELDALGKIVQGLVRNGRVNSSDSKIVYDRLKTITKEFGPNSKNWDEKRFKDLINSVIKSTENGIKK